MLVRIQLGTPLKEMNMRKLRRRIHIDNKAVIQYQTLICMRCSFENTITKGMRESNICECASCWHINRLTDDKLIIIDKIWVI